MFYVPLNLRVELFFNDLSLDTLEFDDFLNLVPPIFCPFANEIELALFLVAAPLALRYF